MFLMISERERNLESSAGCLLPAPTGHGAHTPARALARPTPSPEPRHRLLGARGQRPTSGATPARARFISSGFACFHGRSCFSFSSGGAGYTRLPWARAGAGAGALLRQPCRRQRTEILCLLSVLTPRVSRPTPRRWAGGTRHPELPSKGRRDEPVQRGFRAPVTWVGASLRFPLRQRWFCLSST